MNTGPYAPSLSRTKVLGADSHGKASVICRVSHSAGGCLVTSNQSNRRGPWPKTKNANNPSNVSVGTTHKSIAAIAFAWLRRNAFRPWKGGVLPRTRYLDTVDCATSNPSINNSPRIRGAPHYGFSRPIRRIRSRRAQSIFKRPALFRNFQCQNARKPTRCRRRTIPGSTT